MLGAAIFDGTAAGICLGGVGVAGTVDGTGDDSYGTGVDGAALSTFDGTAGDVVVPDAVPDDDGVYGTDCCTGAGHGLPPLVKKEPSL